MIDSLLIIASDCTEPTQIKLLDWLTAAPAIAKHTVLYLSGSAMQMTTATFEPTTTAMTYLRGQGFASWTQWMEVSSGLVQECNFCPTWDQAYGSSGSPPTQWVPLGLPVVLAQHATSKVMQL